MQELHVIPDGFPLSFAECPPGLFIWENQLCFKDEYGGAYCDSGETFCGGASSDDDRNKIIVQPATYEWRIT